MRNQELIKEMVLRIKQFPSKELNIMEVCGTHTQAISRLGIRQLFEPNIHLLSGPGCPVCVTPEAYIDTAIEILQYPNTAIATFGDMMRVRGTKETLMEQKAKGKDIRIVYSPLAAISLAKQNVDKEIVFLGVGFETTSPLIALAVKLSKERSIKNISFLMGMKRMEPVLNQILSNNDHKIHGLICPGHVAAVVGEDYFRFVTEQYNVPAVIAGFEAEDILGALYFLIRQQEQNKKSFVNLYKACVAPNGNKKAKEIIEEVSTYCDVEWRGIGRIRSSGFALRAEYKEYDALLKLGIKSCSGSEIRCVCSEVLLGKKLPNRCKLFGTVCTPEYPAGPCMVSSEGACAVYYKYKL
ncbi:hydrogenase formation protein HypD [Clostridium swellfunianum]|uniref:hydrogenase formation protein HypD n=1 Tax=Clostridium swellfunianum TaxID=1367462 RepID=UPI00202E6DF6|nr:hydrogenase formation protein HypD [Clostridium swellfunianum]MCM0647774.1 hydrogenase formation protein HypD [Clostridium swellfunianum]